MNIAINGYFDRNFGDDMMIRLAAQQLSNHKLYLYAEREELCIPFKDCPNVVCRNGNAEFDAKLSIIGSGFSVTSKTAFVYAFLQYMKSFIPHKKGVYTAALGCNAGPFVNRFSKILMKRRAAKNDLIIARDKFSYNFFKSCKTDNVYYCPDIVFSMPQSMIPKGKHNCLGISVYRRGCSEKNYGFYGTLADTADRYIEKNNKKVILMAFDIEEENDMSAAFAVKNLCRHPDMIEIAAHTDGGDAILSAMSDCERVIAVRYHSSVLALRMGIPFVPVVYSVKTQNMLDDIRYDGKRFDIDNLNSGELFEAVENAKVFKLPDGYAEKAQEYAKIFEGDWHR